MFGSVGFGELLLIAFVALVVFGPHRLPEIARKAGLLLAKARKATQDFTDAIDAEYEGASSPIRDLQTEYESTKRQITDATSRLADRVVPGDEKAADASEDGSPNDDGATTEDGPVT